MAARFHFPLMEKAFLSWKSLVELLVSIYIICAPFFIEASASMPLGSPVDTPIV